MPYGVTARYWRPDLGRFAPRSPGRLDLPTDTPIAHGKDLTLDDVGPKIQLRPYAGPNRVTLEPSGGWLERYNLGSKLIVGMHFDGVTFDIPNDFPELGVTFAHCLFTGRPPASMPYVSSPQFIGGGVTFDHCEFDGSGWEPDLIQPRVPIDLAHMTVRRCLFAGFDRDMRLSPDTLVEETYCRYVPAPWGDVHQTLISAQVLALSNTVVRRCKLLARREVDPTEKASISAAITHYNNVAHPGPFTVEDCYIAGGGEYAVYLGGWNENGFPHSKYVTFQRNIFGRDFERRCAASGPTIAVTQDPTTVFADNVWGPPGPYWQPGDPAEGDPVAPTYHATGTPIFA